MDAISLKSGAPEPPFTVEHSAEALEKIRLAISDASSSAPDIGGVLVGRRIEDRHITVVDALLLDIDHTHGPAFHISAHDERRLIEALLRARERAGSAPVGWFHSVRGELSFSEADLQLHRRFFSEPWQTLLLIKRDGANPPRASFFFPHCEGAIRAGRLQEFLLQPRRTATPASQTDVDAAVPAFVEPVAPRPATRRTIHAAALLAILAAIAGGGLLSRRQWLPLVRQWASVPQTPAAAPAPTPSAQPPAQAIRLVAIEEQGQLQALWDPTAPEIVRSPGGEISILDADETFSYPLQPEQLQTGSFTYARQSDRVRVRLRIDQPDGSSIMQATTYVAKPLRQLAQGGIGDLATQIARLRSDLAAEKRRSERLQHALDATRRGPRSRRP